MVDNTRPELCEPAEITSLRKELDAEIDELKPRLIELNDWMYHNPEPGFMEFEAADRLTEELKRHDFAVQMGVPGLDEAWPEFDRLKFVAGLSQDYEGPPGLPTAFMARYQGKTQSPVIAIVVEYDALRGDPPFHGCQHNMQGPVGIGAGIALARVMDRHDLPGSVWIIGAPAEEVGPPTKAVLVRAGFMDGVDFAMRTHGTDRDNETALHPGGFSPRHLEQMKYTFHGKSAHAQVPWEGVSALDGVMLLFHAMEIMREHSEPQFRFHGVVSDGGVAPNIIPEMASATIWIRHLIDETPVGSVSPMKAREMIEAKAAQMHDAARGAALATGTTVDIDRYGSYVPSVSVGAFHRLQFEYAMEYGGVNPTETKVPKALEETGFMSLEVPGLHVSMGIEGLTKMTGHSQESADFTISDDGHRTLESLTRVMGAVGLRLVTDPDVREEIEQEHAFWLDKYQA